MSHDIVRNLKQGAGYIWAASCQNEQSDCAPSEDSDQPRHPLRTKAFFMRTAKTLIRLGGCPGWSESSLSAHSFCWFCHVVAHMYIIKIIEPPHDKTNKMACAPREDSDQPGHPSSLIGVFAVRMISQGNPPVFAVRMKKALVLSYPLSAQRRFWPDWADAQADLSLRWAHSHFVGFDMRRIICSRHLASNFEL